MPSNVASWSKIVYQVNNSLYLSGGDGSNPLPLGTGRAGALRRGAAQVAFVADENGRSQVYRVNADGSGRLKLTNAGDGSVDTPAWSPDGQRIAYAWRRTRSDIWVMQADGSAGRRVIYGGSDSLDPAWSPDGQQIAYVTTGGGTNLLSASNADGTNVTILTAAGNLRRPRWSPDGKSILFDALDGNNQQSLYVLNVSTGESALLLAAPCCRPGGLSTDLWAGNWAPDGSAMAYTLTQWNNAGRTSAGHREIRQVSLADHSDRSLIGREGAQLPDWQSGDLTPPVVRVSALPDFSRNPLQVLWLGSDQGEAGLGSFDIETRANGGAWQSWPTTGLATSLEVTHAAGSSVEVRVRARDQAGNLSAFATAPNASRIYDLRVQGQVLDNRGRPLPTTAVALDSGNLGTLLPAAADGSYTVYGVRQLHQSLVVANLGGFGTPDSIPLPDSGLELQANVLMPPATNAVANGSFESGRLTPWVASGDVLPDITAETRHSGSGAARLGRTGVADLYLGGSGQVGAPVMAVDPQARLHVAWLERAGAEIHIKYVIRYSGASWSAVADLGPVNAQGGLLLGAMRDGVFLGWLDNQAQCLYLRRTDSLERTCLASPGPAQGYGAMANDPNGNLHVIWPAGSPPTARLYHAQRTQGTGWTTPDLVYQQSDLILATPAFTIGPDSSMHVVYASGSETGGGGTPLPLSYLTKPAGANWSTPIPLGSESGLNPRLTTTINGSLHLVYVKEQPGGGLSYAYLAKPNNGAWGSQPEDLGPASPQNNAPSLTSTGDGNLHLIGATPDGLVYRSRQGGAWGPPLVLESQPGNSLDASAGALAVDPPSRLFLLWLAAADGAGPQAGNTRLGFADGSRLFGGFTSKISQLVSIPAGMQAPTLAFMARLAPGSAGLLRAFINTTAVVTVTSGATDDWRMAWADLARYQGQNVTLSFVLEKPGSSGGSNPAQVRAYLDEVSLGPAYAMPFIKLSGPLSALPGAGLSLTLAYGNQGGVPAKNVQITFQPAVGLFYQQATPPPTQVTGSSLIWQLSQVAAGGEGNIVVTMGLDGGVSRLSKLISQASITTESTTPGIFPTVASWELVAGSRLFLPWGGKRSP
ncbi:MAG: PD40 domain-containing protein [Chloroflexi bacterium]|nr:PD40 domain-containing protein [Chloroflexota bacterium]